MENKEKKTKHTRLKYADRIEIQRLIEEGVPKQKLQKKLVYIFPQFTVKS